MDQLAGIFDRVDRHIERELERLDLSATAQQHWVLSDTAGAITSQPIDADDVPVPGEFIADLVRRQGVDAAAYVGYFSKEGGFVLAYCAAAPHGSSDVRRAAVSRHGGGVSLGPWEFVIV